jgi:AcrR family transcriptional regulator
MSQSPNRSAGRPRDPLLDQRVQSAACRLYTLHGWASFSIEAVAREARVGKSSIYLRWPDATTLLLDTLQARIDPPYDTDTGSVRGDLVVLTRSSIQLLTSEVGGAVLRLSAEARFVPELAPRWDEYLAANVTAMRRIVRRGLSRGELPKQTPVDLLLDALFGGLLMHFMITPPARVSDLAGKADAYAQALVDFVLRATLGAA